MASGSADAAVTVTPAKGSAVSLDLAQMPVAPDVVDASYTLRSGDSSRTVKVTGYSLTAVFEAADVDPILVGYVEVPRPAGGSVLLSRRQAFTPGAFPEGSPVLYSDSEGTHFLRPSGSDSDPNEADLVTVGVGAELPLFARSGTLLQVAVKASTRKTKTGKPVAFAASLERAGAGEDVAYSWTFGDGTSIRNVGPTISHTFKSRGTYDVLVGVTSAGDRVGASGRVTVQVGEPVKQGPDRKGGGSNRNTKAPDSGPADGAQGPASNGGSGGPTSGLPSYSPPAAATPQPYVPPQSAPEPQSKPPQPTGDQIEGELLADSSIADQVLKPQPVTETDSAKQPVAARTGTADPDGGGGGGVPGVVMGFGATFLMLAGGGLLESRGIGRLRW